MKRNLETTFLKLTAAIVIAGQIQRANSIVELPDTDAKRFLARGKAVVATEAEIKAHLGINGQEDEADPDQPAGEVATEASKEKPKAKATGAKKPA